LWNVNIHLKIFVVLGEGNSLGPLQLLLVLQHQVLINGNLSGCQSRGGDEFERWVANKLPCQPQERLLEVVVRLGRDFEVLQVLLSMESNSACLDFALLDVNFVSTKNDGDVFADTFEITMPVRDIFVRDPGGDVEHDDTALALDVVAIPKTTELLLTGGIPHIEADCAKVGGELERVDLNTESGDVFLFEFTSQVALDKSGLAGSSITDENELECGDDGLFSHVVDEGEE